MKRHTPPYLGAAYYPEAWPREDIDTDLNRMQRQGLDTVRVAEFAWATMEPREGEYDFSLFREVVDKCKKRGMAVIMCTPSATPPKWMVRKYPTIMATVNGTRVSHGGRRDTCPTDPTYRELCRKINREMAREFGADENVIGWQLDNELIPQKDGFGCTCPTCTADFRRYLRSRYDTIEALNDAWGNFTWSLAYSDFEEIDPPDKTTGYCASLYIVWSAYKNEVYAELCREWADTLREFVTAPIGTDTMPIGWLDVEKTAASLDVMQLNHYSGPRKASFWFDFYRAMKDRPFWVTETSANHNDSQFPNGPRLPGFCRANTLLGFARGAEATLYWLFRAHRAGHEQAHGSLVDAWGREMQTADEVRSISSALTVLSPALRGTRVSHGGLATVMGGIPYYIRKYLPMASRLPEYHEAQIHRLLSDAHFSADVVGTRADLSRYKMLVSIGQYTLDEDGFAERVYEWVKAGGTWVVGPLSDIATPDGTKYKHAPFGHLEDWCKVYRVYSVPAPHKEDRYAAFAPVGERTRIRLLNGKVVETAAVAYDAFRADDGSRVLGKYEKGGNEYIANYPAIVETKVGRGRIILMGAQLENAALTEFLAEVAEECGITPVAEADASVETVLREGEYGRVLCLVETAGAPGEATAPFTATDILTGKRVQAGEKIALSAYECLFLKEEA
ncbi:MAG: beta-galactosidase [Clostridia bacterium]|nr:beta-galactosidase [Clostridia bacterium]